MTDTPLDVPAAELGIDLPDEKLILKAGEVVDGLDRTRALYQLSLRYRELAHEALLAAQLAASEANAQGVTFREIAAHAGCKSTSSLTKVKVTKASRWR